MFSMFCAYLDLAMQKYKGIWTNLELENSVYLGYMDEILSRYFIFEVVRVEVLFYRNL